MLTFSPISKTALIALFVLIPQLLLASETGTESWKLPDSFPDDFNAPIDSGGLGKGQPIQGFGGKGEVTRNPVIFIHGNGADSSMFREYARIFHYKFGYNASELWAFSFQGYPNNKRLENRRNKLPHPHEYAAQDMHEMVERILAYTGKEKVSLFTYSLGVTVARHYLKKYDAYDKVDIFVSVAGANHGFIDADKAGEVDWTPEGINKLCLHESGDETPYGEGKDQGSSVKPDADRNIKWLVFHGGKDDWIINLSLKTFLQVDNTHSALLDGADLSQSYEGKFDNLRKPYGAHGSFYSEPDKWFSDIAPYFRPAQK